MTLIPPDELVGRQSILIVIPAKAGIQERLPGRFVLDPRFRGGDGREM